MSSVVHVALVSLTRTVPMADVARVGAAIQKQVSRDFGPSWGVQATVDGFARLEEVPIAYWPVIVLEDIHSGSALGYHLDSNNQPYALVKHTSGWETTASHETLEMLADPFGNRIVAGQSIKRGQGRVQYLIEVCDPSEAVQFGYTVNGLLMSDFYTPHFFDPVKNPAVRYSFTGAITAPRTVLRGGYLSWLDPVSNHLWQQVWFGANKQFRDLGPVSANARSLRAEVDRRTPRDVVSKGVPETDRYLKAARTTAQTIERSTAARAKALRAEIEAVAAG